MGSGAVLVGRCNVGELTAGEAYCWGSVLMRTAGEAYCWCHK